MSDKINVMIVEDQAMPRQLFEAIVKSEPRLNLAVSIDNAEIATYVVRATTLIWCLWTS